MEARAVPQLCNTFEYILSSKEPKKKSIIVLECTFKKQER